MSIDEIKQLIREGRYEVSIHAQQERLEDDLDIEEIESAVPRGISSKIIRPIPAVQVVS